MRGTGLGLSICKMVMALHGGSITVASSSSGTTFTLRFPRSFEYQASLAERLPKTVVSP